MTLGFRKNDGPWCRDVFAGVLLVGLLLVLPLAKGPAQARGAPNPATDPGSSGDEPAPAERIGQTIRITLPITGKTFKRVQRMVLGAIDRARAAGGQPVLIFEFEVPEDQTDYAGRSEYGASYELADFLSGGKLSGTATVAYVPQSIQGHAVLVVLACDEILMAPKAEIGSAGVDEPTITPPIYKAYEEIAGRRKKVPAAVALGLLDPSKRVLQVETEISREYVLAEDLEELSNRRTIRGKPKVLFEAGQPGRLSGREARDLDFVSAIAFNRRDVARTLDLRPDAVEEDPSLAGGWEPVRVDLKGPITAQAVDQAQLAIEEAIRRRQVNFICLWIDSAGGSPTDSSRLAAFLASDLDSADIRTVAYVPVQALADASIVAMACDQVVMHPRAVLGGVGDYDFSHEEIAEAQQTLREVIAPRKSRSWSLPAAMINPELDVFRCTRKGNLKYFEYFCDEELEEQSDSSQWIKNESEEVTRPERPFQVEGEDALEYWLANDVVNDFSEFKGLYGLEDDPMLVEPGWAFFLIDALAHPGVAILLLMIGGAAMYAELHAPGIGIGGFVALLCFVLFFWSRFMGHTAGWLEVMLFAAGVGCLLLEVFVLPGFGIFGLGGGLLIIGSLILASQTFVFPRNAYQVGELERSLVVIAGATVGIIATAVLLNRWLPKSPVFGQMMLEPTLGEQAETLSQRESLVHFEDLLGARGKTTTRLMPCGKARFGNRLLSVMADGEAIARGTEIVVVEVEGNQILVRSVE